MQKSSALRKPRRYREMPHIHYRGETALLQRPQDFAVVFYLRFVEPPLFRLDARPLDGEAMARVAQRARYIEVLLIAVIMIACAPCRRHFPLAPRSRPIPILNSAFHLIGGGRCAPDKSVGKGFHAFNGSTAEQVAYGTDSHRESECKKGEFETPEEVPRGEASDTREYQERVRVHSPNYGTTCETLILLTTLRARSACGPWRFGVFPSGRATA